MKRAMTVLTNLLRKPTLLLFHINLLGNPDCILGVGLGYGAVVDGLAVQRADGFAEVEDVGFGGFLLASFRRDPIDHICSIWICCTLRGGGYVSRIPCDVLGLRSDVR